MCISFKVADLKQHFCQCQEERQLETEHQRQCQRKVADHQKRAEESTSTRETRLQRDHQKQTQRRAAELPSTKEARLGVECQIQCQR